MTSTGSCKYCSVPLVKNISHADGTASKMYSSLTVHNSDDRRIFNNRIICLRKYFQEIIPEYRWWIRRNLSPQHPVCPSPVRSGARGSSQAASRLGVRRAARSTLNKLSASSPYPRDAASARLAMKARDDRRAGNPSRSAASNSWEPSPSIQLTLTARTASYQRLQDVVYEERTPGPDQGSLRSTEATSLTGYSGAVANMPPTQHKKARPVTMSRSWNSGRRVSAACF